MKVQIEDGGTRSLRPCRAACLAVSAVFVLAGCASSTWERTAAARWAGGSGTLLIPRLFRPLLPGSVYPDRRTPIPVRSRPAVVLVAAGDASARALRGAAAPYLAERGLVVLATSVRREPGEAAAKAVFGAAGYVSSRPESAGARIGLLLVEPADGLVREVLNGSRFDAVALAVFLPAASPGPRSAGGKPVLVLNRAGQEGPSPELSHRLGRVLPAPVERWYGGPGKVASLPPHAFRDAAEWLEINLEK